MEDPNLDEQLLEELGPALDAWAPPAARDAFREAARSRFVVGDLTRALEAYGPRPRDEFRADVRAAFLVDATEATEAERGLEELPDLPAHTVQTRPVARARPAGRSDRSARDPRAPRDARSTRTRFRLLLGGAVASLAAAAVLLIWVLQPGSTAWRVEAQGFSPAGIHVDGVALAADAAPADLARRLAGARELRSGDAAVRLVLGENVVVVELGPDSVLDLSRVPEDPSADLHFRGDVGSFRIATGAGYRRGTQELSFRALEVDVEVTGTVFGIDVYDADVCVCCCEGSVHVRGGGEESELEPGRTRYVHADGHSDFAQDLKSHQEPLRALIDYRRTLP